MGSFVARNPPRVDAERGDHFLQADLSLPINLRLSDLCTVKAGSEAASFINFKPSQERSGYRDRVHHGAIPTADQKELARVR
jgi:hypothetical protein